MFCRQIQEQEKKKKGKRIGWDIPALGAKAAEVFPAKLTVLKRLFEYSNIFEQGFQNEYSNTKIENRIFEKVMNRAPSSSVDDVQAVDQPRRWGPPRRLHPDSAADQTADHRTRTAVHGCTITRSDSRIDTVWSLAIRVICPVWTTLTKPRGKCLDCVELSCSTHFHWQVPS